MAKAPKDPKDTESKPEETKKPPKVKEPGLIERLNQDLIDAATNLSVDEARFLVDNYYLIQDGRKRAASQVRAMEMEPTKLIQWLESGMNTLENQIKRALDKYSDNHPVGIWMKSNYGVGPVIAAGLLAHIDIEKVETAGEIWRFAGLDPTSKWAPHTKRPWNAQLKTLCWHIGQSFMKFSNQEECVYGHMYKERKAFEVERNEAGRNAMEAARLLREKKWNPATDAVKHMKGGKLPPAQIDARARRWVVKIFLSHMQQVWHWHVHGKLAPVPYVIEHKGHVHIIPIPNQHLMPGMAEAKRPPPKNKKAS